MTYINGPVPPASRHCVLLWTIQVQTTGHKLGNRGLSSQDGDLFNDNAAVLFKAARLCFKCERC